jgi:hypothetical protein
MCPGIHIVLSRKIRGIVAIAFVTRYERESHQQWWKFWLVVAKDTAYTEFADRENLPRQVLLPEKSFIMEAFRWNNRGFDEFDELLSLGLGLLPPHPQPHQIATGEPSRYDGSIQITHR